MIKEYLLWLSQLKVGDYVLKKHPSDSGFQKTFITKITKNYIKLGVNSTYLRNSGKNIITLSKIYPSEEFYNEWIKIEEELKEKKTKLLRAIEKESDVKIIDIMLELLDSYI